MKPETIIILLAGILSIPLFLVVHYFYGWVCICHVRRYCTKNGIEISGWRIAPAFDKKGVKTESSQIEVLTEYTQKKKIHRFIVWPFGVREVTEFEQENNQTTEPNKAVEPTIIAVTVRAPSSTNRASHDRGSL